MTVRASILPSGAPRAGSHQQPLRLVYVISGLEYGGAETQVIAIARAFAQRGHCVAVYTLNAHTPRAHELEGSGVSIVTDQKRRKLDPAVILRLRRFLREFRATVVHGFLHDSNLYCRLAAAGTGITVLDSERSSNYSLKASMRAALRLTRPLSHGLVANSHVGARFARTVFGLPEAQLHVVWNGVDLELLDRRVALRTTDYKQTFFGSTQIRVACLVGAIKPAKDYHLALEIAHRLTADHPDWRVLFVGDEFSRSVGYKAEIMRRYTELALQDRTVFAGLRADAVEMMSQADVVFSTSRHEGFPNVVLEAMAVGTPVVATEYSDIRRILPQPWQIVADRDPAGFVSALLRAHRDRAELSRQQRAWVEANATVAVAADRLLAVYGRCRGAARANPPARVERTL